MKTKNIKPSHQDVKEIPMEKRLILQERMERQAAHDHYTMGIQGKDGGCWPQNPMENAL
jgi:hypothetical protein